MPPSNQPISLLAQAEVAAEYLRNAWAAVWAQPVLLVQTGEAVACHGLLDQELASLPLAALPGMPPAGTTTLGQQPLRLVLGRCDAKPILLLEGHYHLYDGLGVRPCVLPIATAGKLGITKICLVDAAIAVRDEFAPGTVVALTDYINRLGATPLLGLVELAAAGFADMTEAFSQELLSDFVNAAAWDAFAPRLGTYQADLGPQAATPCEVAAARRNGIDLLGPGMVLETILANALHAQLLALAIVAAPAASHGMVAMHRDRALAHVRAASKPVMQALRRLANIL